METSPVFLPKSLHLRLDIIQVSEIHELHIFVQSPNIPYYQYCRMYNYSPSIQVWIQKILRLKCPKAAHILCSLEEIESFNILVIKNSLIPLDYAQNIIIKK
jgi:hypothetical protein